jgi:hypothetical protein
MRLNMDTPHPVPNPKEIRAIFEEVVANLDRLSIEEIRERLHALMDGMVVTSPMLAPGTFLYRARKVDATFNKAAGIRLADLSYPPKDRTRAGRLNRDSDPMFYCSVGKESLFFEIPNLQAGDEIVISIWKVAHEGYLNSIGYTSAVFDRLGAKRECPTWKATGDNGKAEVTVPTLAGGEIAKLLERDESATLRELMSEYFSRHVDETNTMLYKLTTAIAELHYKPGIDGNERFAGVAYPSIRMWANADNIALAPWYVAENLEFRKAIHLRIDKRDEQRFSFTSLDSARHVAADGHLDWLGRPLNWTTNVGPGRTLQCTATSGPDDDGDYESSKEGTPIHWVVVVAETGEVIPAS